VANFLTFDAVAIAFYDVVQKDFANGLFPSFLQHGIRWTAMPGWKNVLSEQQIWQLVTFLSHMHDLPPAAQHVFAEPTQF
jgi:hypothetical protein